MLATALLVPLLLTATFQGPQGHTQLATGQLTPPLQGELPTAVSVYALQQRDALGLPVTSTLSAPEVFGTRFGASFHLRQKVDGFEVHGARVVVTVDRNRRVVQLASSVVPYRTAVLEWKVSAQEALQRASEATQWAMRDGAGQPYGGTRRMMFRRGDQVRSGYLVYVPTVDLKDNWYLAVDASTGEVLWRQNRVYHATDEADVYAMSPGTQGVGVAPLTRVTLNHFATPRADGGVLEGDQLSLYNCCPNQNCDPSGAPRRTSGTTSFNGTTVPYDMAICDRLQRASNVSNASGNYVFTPVDPPTSNTVAQSEPADSDPFAEVHAYFHVNNVYDFVRGLSTAANPLFPAENIPAFQMRDEKLGKKPAVWTNVTLPNQQEAYTNFFTTGVARSNSLMRVDNAAFMAKENFEQLMLPGVVMDVDTLMIFQGNSADFGYDAPILWHEFGHGVIYSTAAFESFTLDARSGNNEGGALHEGIADYLAGAFGNNSIIGAYVGPKLASQTGVNGPIRDMNNNFACPDVLWGEVHQDSMHFSAALWDARKEFGTDATAQGKFDAAMYAALVSMTPATDFAQAAATVSNHVKLAFGAAQESRMAEIFNARAVTNCSKVVDVTGTSTPKTYYGIGGWEAAGFASAQTIPGPYQMKLSVPNGAKSVSVSAAFQGGFFGGAPTAKLLVKGGSPITFTKSSTSLTNDADKVANFVAASNGQKATAQIDVPCGGELYFTLGSPEGGGETLQNVAFELTQADSCPVVDAGTQTDGGTGGGTVNVPGVPGGGAQAGGEVAQGCGCTSVSPMIALGALLALAGALRRRRQ